MEGDNSKGACSLLNHCKLAAGSDALKGAMSVRSSKQVGNCYKITTFGLASSNEWHASSIRPNSEGGSDYTLVRFLSRLISQDQRCGRVVKQC